MLIDSHKEMIANWCHYLLRLEMLEFKKKFLSKSAVVLGASAGHSIGFDPMGWYDSRTGLDMKAMFLSGVYKMHLKSVTAGSHTFLLGRTWIKSLNCVANI